MGYLHEGHLRLVDRARELADRVVVSIFVNPLQFGPHEDLARYPRDLPRDRTLAGARGVDCVFVPDTAGMYPAEPLVRVVPGPVADTLEGMARPGHFTGVLTVVAKLFDIVEPDVAVFGRKDFQQAMLVKRMVQDLDFGLTIDIAPTVRELDGLALSSRNTYLTPDERRQRAWGRPVSSTTSFWAKALARIPESSREPARVGAGVAGTSRAYRARRRAPAELGGRHAGRREGAGSLAARGLAA